jgi:hypothetical protein
MNPPPHLHVESGPDQGRDLIVPPAGARLGRASQNDFVLADPLLSRHHCRFEFRGDDGLWVLDLASANQTLVNGQPVTEVRIRPGDTVLVGDSLLRVVSDAPLSGEALAALTAGTPVVDLGFDAARRPAAPRHNLRPVLWTAGALAVLAIGAAVFLKSVPRESRTRARPLRQERRYDSVLVRYEKIEADRANIFRYQMTLSPGQVLAVQIDDLAQNRHARKEARVDTNLVMELARDIEAGGFFGHDERYAGVPIEGTWNSWDLTVVLDRQAHRCQVSNRTEPDAFRALREKLETFGKNELGIWAIQFSRERLVELSRDAFTRGRKKSDERDISYGNLAQAIACYREAEFYLDTVEPKPEFYGEIVTGLQQCREELDRRYAEQRFRADRAINLQDWAGADTELRILCDLIPDRGDERHREAERKLIDVQNRRRMRSR